MLGRLGSVGYVPPPTVARLWQQYEGTGVGQQESQMPTFVDTLVAHKFNDSKEPQLNKVAVHLSQDSQRFVCLPQDVSEGDAENKCGIHFLKCSTPIIVTKPSARLAESLLWVCWILSRCETKRQRQALARWLSAGTELNAPAAGREKWLFELLA